MSPQIIQSKLTLLYEVLSDLKPHINEAREMQDNAHYEIERQVQLVVEFSIAIGRRILILNEIPTPETAREVFLELGKRKILPLKLSFLLANAVGLRNLIVHEYGKIDYSLFFGGLKDAYQGFVQFAKIVSRFKNRKK